MSKETGGPAFPIAGVIGANGMTLRDYFANNAGEKDVEQALHVISMTQQPMPPLARRAKARYMVADAMISERAK